MALGPANNPHAEIEPSNDAVILNTPSGSGHEFIQTGRINHILGAKPDGKGIMNNVNLVVDSLADLMYLGQNAQVFMNMPGWVYFSGELTEGGTWGGHGAVYWFFLIFGASPVEALEMANSRPYGIYLSGHDLGWK